MRKKKLSLDIILVLLQKDISFLKSIKKKLESLSPTELFEILKVLKKLSYK